MVDRVENGWEGRWLMGLRMVGRGGGCWGLGWLGGEVVDGVENGWEGRWLMGLRMVGRGGGCWG